MPSSVTEFFTDQVFDSNQELVDWVQKVARSYGYVLVTKRSKKKDGYLSKIILMCDRGGLPRSSGGDVRDNQSYIIGQGLGDFLPYITQVQNVTGDGNCGLRVIAICLGHHQDNWRQIRRDLLHELDVHNATYTYMFNEEDVQSLQHRLNHFKKGFAPRAHWMDMSLMGLLIASWYSVVVIVLSNDGETTFLPLFTSPPTSQPHNIWVIGHVNGDHFVRLVLQGDFPMPLTHPLWSFHAFDRTWEIPYLHTQNAYNQLKFPNRNFAEVKTCINVDD